MRTTRKYLELLQNRALLFNGARDVFDNKNLFEAFKEMYKQELQDAIDLWSKNRPTDFWKREEDLVINAIAEVLSSKKLYKRISIYKSSPKKEKKDNQNPFLHKTPQPTPMSDTKVRVPRKTAKNRWKNFKRMISMGIVSDRFIQYEN
jgi:hypothetical protein